MYNNVDILYELLASMKSLRVLLETQETVDFPFSNLNAMGWLPSFRPLDLFSLCARNSNMIWTRIEQKSIWGHPFPKKGLKVTVHCTMTWGGVYRARRRNNLEGLRTLPKLLCRSCKNAQNAHPNENKGGAAAESRRPPLFSLLMAFEAFLHERRNNLGGSLIPLIYCAAWPCRPPQNDCEVHRYVHMFPLSLLFD